MDFSAFDTARADEYAKEAKARWGGTDAYAEYERNTAGQSKEDLRDAGAGLMEILSVFGRLREKPVSSPEVQSQVKTLQDYITTHFYTCTDEILMSLGRTYTGGGDFTANIDSAGGPGTAAFAQSAIEIYCRH